MRSLGGFYTVISEDGTRTECRGRGIFRRDATTLLVGDRCRFEPTEPGCGSITAIAPRKNTLQRPPVANLDRLAMVISLADPAPNALVIDQLTAIAARRDIPVVMIFTKPDLAGPDPLGGDLPQGGLPHCRGEQPHREGADRGRCAIKGRDHGLLRQQRRREKQPDERAVPRPELGDRGDQQKLGRGRHTTRHVELSPMGTAAGCVIPRDFRRWNSRKRSRCRRRSWRSASPRWRNTRTIAATPGAATALSRAAPCWRRCGRADPRKPAPQLCGDL